MIVNVKGQIVIPKDVREKFGIYPGQRVEFEEDRGKVVLVKKGLLDQFQKKAGKYKFDFPKGIKSTQDFMEKARGR